MYFERSTLANTLDKRDYPIDGVAAIYSPTVAIFKSFEETGFKDLNPNKEEVSIVSVISVAAQSRPKTSTPEMVDVNEKLFPGDHFTNSEDAELLQEKIRLSLRIAAHYGHSNIVLGALGCGAFRNPPYRVAELFYHTLMEEEFAGGWWQNVVFAVKCPKEVDGWGEDLYSIFWRTLQGVVV